MRYQSHLKRLAMTMVVMLLMVTIGPSNKLVSGEIPNITVAKEMLEGVTEEEQKALDELFTLTQEIEEMEREEARLQEEIYRLREEIKELESSIEKEENAYQKELDLLEKVIILYQKGGPGSYLEMILSSKDISTFLSNLGLLSDISRNVNDVLETIDESKAVLEEERRKLQESVVQLQEKEEAMQAPIAEKKRLLLVQEDTIRKLEEEKKGYRDQLNSIEIMWNDLKGIFLGLVHEFERIIGEGHFTMEDMNLNFSLFQITGSVEDASFNRILEEQSSLGKIVFDFQDDLVILEVPEKKLILYGRFVLQGNTGIVYVVEEGTFYGMTLEQASLEELFKEGPLYIDFEAVAGDLVTVDINLTEIKSREGFIDFTIKINLFNFGG